MATVLVVDDHDDNRQLLVTLLGYQSHRVIEASNGKEALGLIGTIHVDLVITDILMPVMDGYELVRELRRSTETASTPVIFYTANYLQDEVRPVAEACGVEYVLPKPGEPEEILTIVEQALRHGSPVSSTVPGTEFEREHLRALSTKLVDKVRELEATQAALRASEARFRSLADSSPIGIVSLDLDGQAQYTNRRLQEIWGIPAEDLLGMGWVDAVHDDDQGRVAGGVGAAIDARSEYRLRLRVRRPDGTVRWVDVHGGPVHGDDGAPTAYVGTVEDVTEVVEAQREREVLEARLRLSERLEGLGQLAGGIAHDFNNLLGVILNYAEFVKQGIDDLGPDTQDGSGTLRDDMEEIRRAAQRAADLTSQLLIFGRREVVHPEVLDPNVLVREMEQLLVRTIGEHVTLGTRLGEDVRRITVDPTRFEQVLLNLVVNARDAIGETGSILLSTENVELDAETAGLHNLSAPGPYVCLSVADTGEGMTPDVLEHLFEPFFTTKPVGRGTGLGLATVYGIVQQWGGSVTVYSEPGSGTTFRVHIPVASGVGDRRVEPTHPAPRPGGGERVLVVEDEPGVRATTCRILTTNGYVAVPASNGREALDLLRYEHVEVDLLLTDVVMPEMSGRELADHALGLRPGLPVLFMSGYAESLLTPQSRVPEGIALLEKPFTSASLLAAVATTLDRGC